MLNSGFLEGGHSISSDMFYFFNRSEEREEEKDEDVDVNQSVSSMASASNMEVCL